MSDEIKILLPGRVAKPRHGPRHDDQQLDIRPDLRGLVARLAKGIDELTARGLNEGAVVVLLYHACSKRIGVKAIAEVLKKLRQLPEIYGRREVKT